jgi:hypothetical protein
LKTKRAIGWAVAAIIAGTVALAIYGAVQFHDMMQRIG